MAACTFYQNEQRILNIYNIADKRRQVLKVIFEILTQIRQGRIFWGGGGAGGCDQHHPQKNRNWHRLQTFALWQSRFLL